VEGLSRLSQGELRAADLVSPVRILRCLEIKSGQELEFPGVEDFS
jgi:hypothetical protein